MHIKKHISYDAHKKWAIGYVDQGMGPEEDAEEATDVLVFMVVDIMSRWKAPVSYYFTRGLIRETLVQLLLHAIDAVQSSGLRVSSNIL